MTKVKICGMTRPLDVDMARSADFLGFVVDSRSSRNLELPAAKELMSITDLKKVMVTACSDPSRIVEMANQLEPDVVQVHSLMGPADLGLITNRISGSVWALAPVGGGDEDERVNRIRNTVNAVVLDTKGEVLGGQGVPHDWLISRRLRDMVYPYPVVLAGGLRAENVHEAIRQVRPFCVDVSSGVEHQSVKDPRLVRSFVRRVREAGT